jgi:microcystin-dependent protein
LTSLDDTFTDKFRTGDDPLIGVVYYLVKMPQQLWFIAQVADALVSLSLERNWEQGGSVSIDDAIQAATDMLAEFKPMVGTIFLTAWATVPAGYLVCDGSTYARDDFPLLYAALDSAFIIDADNFTVPDLQDRVPVGVGTNSMADTGGEATHTLIVSEMPSHAHSDTGHLHALAGEFPGLALSPGELPVDVPGSGEFTAIGNANITSTGGGDAHNNLQPYITLLYVIVAG